MAVKIYIEHIDHKSNPMAGSGGVDAYSPISLGESLDFQNNEFLKDGGFPLNMAGKLAKATTAEIIAGFFDSRQFNGQYNTIERDFRVVGDVVGVLDFMQARVTVAKPAGTPVYLDDDGNFSDTQGTVKIICGYYMAYDPMRSRGVPFKSGENSYIVRFETRFTTVLPVVV